MQIAELWEPVAVPRDRPQDAARIPKGNEPMQLVQEIPRSCARRVLARRETYVP